MGRVWGFTRSSAVTFTVMVTEYSTPPTVYVTVTSSSPCSYPVTSMVHVPSPYPVIFTVALGAGSPAASSLFRSSSLGDTVHSPPSGTPSLRVSVSVSVSDRSRFTSIGPPPTARSMPSRGQSP